MNCNTEKQVVFCCLCCRKIQRLCKARAEAKFTWIMPSRRQRCIYMNVCARREQKPSLLGLCRAAANFRASECRAELVRAMPSAAENVKKKVHLYETFAHVSLYAIFSPKNPAYPSLMPYLLVYKCVASVWFAGPTLH